MKEIVDYQDSYYKKGNNVFNFIGVINIHSCKEDGKNYLVDGQHRFKAMKDLYKKHNYADFDVNVEVVLVKTRDDLMKTII